MNKNEDLAGYTAASSTMESHLRIAYPKPIFIITPDGRVMVEGEDVSDDPVKLKQCLLSVVEMLKHR